MTPFRSLLDRILTRRYPALEDRVAYATYVKWADARRTPKDSILRPQAFGMRFSEKHERVRRSFGQVYVGVRLATDRMF